ncbi:MAG: serine/threonine-protein kinase [Rhodothermales bacterium]|nr:serine/threonine-protein kinase [Rhodothermales bacterium]
MYPRPESFIGKEVDGHRIDAVLGRGGMGIVFKAENIELSRTVALKIINPALAQDDSFIRRFRLEARALAQIHHPNIVLVYAFRPFDFGYYISMEYVHGPTLAEYLEANGALSWNESVFLLKQMLSAFHFAHSAGVIHRDIKPRNILLAPNNVVKITDFGLAKVVQEGAAFAHDTTVTVATGGTIHYMPPEQIRGLKNVDHRGDLFSLGMSMYESLTGTLPFDKNASGYTIQKIIVEEPFPDIRKNNAEIPRALAKIIMKALEKDPDKRYQSAAEMKAAIEEFENEQHMSGATTLYVQGSQMPGVTLRSSRGKLYSLVAASTVCLALALLVFYRPNRASNADSGLNGDPTPIASYPPMEPSDTLVNPNDGVTVIPGDILDSLAAPVDTSALVAIPITAETGGMRIRTEPTGASIRINGRYYGRTPANLNELPAGPLRISLERQGYMPVVVEDRIEAGVVRTSRTTLLPVQGTISLSVRPFGDVYVGGELVQAGVQDSLELHLPPDTHLVSVRNPDFGEWRSTVIVTPGDPKVMSVDFTQTIRLIVTTFDLDGNRVESAEIMLDDKPTGSYTPGPVDIPIGVRRLEARIEGYEPAYPIEARNFDGSVSGPLRFILRKLPEDG